MDMLSYLLLHRGKEEIHREIEQLFINSSGIAQQIF